MAKTWLLILVVVSTAISTSLGVGLDSPISAAQPPAHTRLYTAFSLEPASVERRAGTSVSVEHALLLYDSSHPSSTDGNFCKIVEYYGQRCAQIALDLVDLTDASLRDEQGNYFWLIGISADTLSANPPLLLTHELSLLTAAVEQGGTKLSISKAHADIDPGPLTQLTDGAVVAVVQTNAKAGWIVSDADPEITEVFTGQAFSDTSGRQHDFSLILSEQTSATPLLSALDDDGAAYPVLVKHEKGLGTVFIESGEPCSSLEHVPLHDVYYWGRFSQIVPLMITTRYAFGDKAWHSPYRFANLVINDPGLIEPYEEMSYVALLRAMRAHDFHTTIALIPANWRASQVSVVTLFRTNPDRFSLIQHGNNHDGYEFYKYSVTTEDKYPARPLADQEADIIEGMQRMALHFSHTGIPWDKVMMFPWEISPAETFKYLKKFNFLGTVNAQRIPLDATLPPGWDFGMYPAAMQFETFPSLLDRHPGAYHPFKPDPQPFVLDLFLGKPAVFYSHCDELFAESMDSFNPVADYMNALYGGVKWSSLGDILRHLYLEKINDDGSVDIQMFCSELVVSNESNEEQTYHFFKEESLNVPIASLTVDGQDMPYKVVEGLLMFDANVPGNSSSEILIKYGDPDP